MTDITPPDPFALSRELVTKWEQSVNAELTKLMSTSEFAKQIHESMGAPGATPKLPDKMPTLPTLATNLDIARIGERLASLEEQVAQAITLLERLTPPDAAANRAPVPRTKQFSKSVAAKKKS